MLSTQPSNHPSLTGSIATSASSVRPVATIAGLLFLSMVPVTMLVAPLKELIGDRFGASPFWTHSFMSVNMIGAVLTAPIIGLLSDRQSVRRAVAAFALLADGFLLAGMSLAPSLTGVFVLRFLEGAAHILVISTLMAVASGWAGEKHRGRTMGLIGASMMFGTACGTRLGGAVYLALPDHTFIVAGTISIIAAVLTFLFVRESTHDAPHKEGIKKVFTLLREHPALWTAYAYSFIDRLSVGVVITTFGLFLANVHQLDPGARSHLLLIFLLPFSLLVYPAGRLVDRIGRVWPISIGTIGFGIVFASYGFVPANLLWISMALSGIVSAIMFAPNLTLVADLTPPTQRGAAFTGFNIAGSLGFVLGPLMAGTLFSLASKLLSDRTAYDVTFVFTGCLEIMCALITLPMLLKTKRAGQTY